MSGAVIIFPICIPVSKESVRSAYYKEGCETDQGWCFKSAVGNSLPSTFFSYGKPPPTDPAALQIAYTTVASMAVPPDSEVLTKVGNSTSSQATPSSAQSNDWQRRDGSDTYPTLAQQSSLRGYSDGFLTAKIFAQNGWSKLGFTGQYIEDSLRAVEPSITPGTQDNYRSAFRMGLADGEDGVEAVLA